MNCLNQRRPIFDEVTTTVCMNTWKLALARLVTWVWSRGLKQMQEFVGQIVLTIILHKSSIKKNDFSEPTRRILTMSISDIGPILRIFRLTSTDNAESD